MPSRPDRHDRVALIACGALAEPAAEVTAARGWPLDIHPLPPLLHNRPQLIADRVAELARRLQGEYRSVVVGYADCGTYGALDEVCDQLGLRRLAGLHCYDVYASATRIEALLAEEPGSYLLTDFLVRSFARTVLRELGLDRYPELRDVYFGNYRRVVWLAQQPTAELHALAATAAKRLELPLTVLRTGLRGLERELGALVGERVS